MIAGNVVNVILEIALVYGLDLGIKGSAWGTVVAQTGMGIAMAIAILRRVGLANAGLRPALARRLLSLGKFIFIRTVSLIASFVLAGVVVTRLGDAPLAAHQIAFQLWIFIALVLDAIAIAGQIIVGQELGASRPDAAYDASVRMIWLSIIVGAAFSVVLLALSGVIPRAFTSDAEVLSQCALLWPLFALMQPLNGIVFAIDGILIGASDGRYLALSMAAAFAVCAAMLAVVAWAGWGVRGVWAALFLLIVTRLTPDGRSLPPAALARDRVRLALGGRVEHRPEPVGPHRHLREAGPEDVAVRVGGKLLAELAGLGDDDVAPRLPRVIDPLREQGVLAALAPCSGRVAAKPRYPTPSAMNTPAAAAGSSPSRASQQSQPSFGASAAQGAAAAGRP